MNIPHFGLKRQYNNLKDELLEATDNVLKGGQLVGGHYTRTFESWLRSRCQAKYAVTVHSGTQALQIIAKFHRDVYMQRQRIAIGNPKIRIPNLTYPATLNAFLSTGWDVELVDTDKYGIAKFNDDKKFNCLVGLYGMQPWHSSRIEHSPKIIVDGAQHWLECNGQIGASMAISFDPTKNLSASGNGGAIITNDEHLYLYACKYKDNFKPFFEEEGTNSKISELDCAHLLVRSKHLVEWQNRRKAISKYWCDRFRELPLDCLSDTDIPHAHQKFVVYLADRNSLHTHMLQSGVDTKIHYEYVLGDLPVSRNLTKPDLLSTSVMLSRGVLSLPIYPELTDLEVDYIADKVVEFFESA